MINAYHVKTSIHPVHALAPETIFIRFHMAEIIGWHAPALSVFGKIIWWTTGNEFGFAIAINHKIRTITPNIRTIQIHIKRNIPHNLYAFFMRIGNHFIQLFIEDKLQEFNIEDLFLLVG